MPPEERFVPRFAAEPPQEELPYGRWEERLREEFLSAALALDGEEPELGAPGELTWYPDRTWHGRTYVPATARTAGGFELFGYVRFLPGGDDEEPSELTAHVDFTSETAERNPDWRMDLCEEIIGSWRGQFGASAAMTLVWGRPLISGGRIATAELADMSVDQCEVTSERFTLVAPDDYRGDLLEIKLFDVKGRELASESLYAGDEDDEEDDAEEIQPDEGVEGDALTGGESVEAEEPGASGS
ncbi:MAG TPA: hypothetical protein VH025_08640 [Solirubrobacteraceae bacterium]|jgi:hypothetical protein|nr:hypothetical protein [Solirubrobacteraceae bacterium]